MSKLQLFATLFSFSISSSIHLDSSQPFDVAHFHHLRGERMLGFVVNDGVLSADVDCDISRGVDGSWCGGGSSGVAGSGGGVDGTGRFPATAQADTINSNCISPSAESEGNRIFLWFSR